MSDGEHEDESARRKREDEEQAEKDEDFMDMMNGFTDRVEERARLRKQRAEEEKQKQLQQEQERKRQQIFADDLAPNVSSESADAANPTVASAKTPERKPYRPYKPAKGRQSAPVSTVPYQPPGVGDDYAAVYGAYQLGTQPPPSPSAPPAFQHSNHDEGPYNYQLLPSSTPTTAAHHNYPEPSAPPLHDSAPTHHQHETDMYSLPQHPSSSQRQRHSAEPMHPQGHTHSHGRTKSDTTGWSAIEQSMMESQPSFDAPMHSSLFRVRNNSIYDIDAQLKARIRNGRQVGIDAVDLEQQGYLREAEKKYIDALAMLFPLLKELDKGTVKNVDERKRQKLNIKKEVTAMMDRCEGIKKALKTSQPPDVPSAMPTFGAGNGGTRQNKPRNVETMDPFSPPDVPSVIPKFGSSQVSLNEPGPAKRSPNEGVRREDYLKTPVTNPHSVEGKGPLEFEKSPQLMSILNALDGNGPDAGKPGQQQVGQVHNQQQQQRPPELQNQFASPPQDHQHQHSYLDQEYSQRKYQPQPQNLQQDYYGQQQQQQQHQYETSPSQYNSSPRQSVQQDPQYPYVASNVTEHEEDVRNQANMYQETRRLEILKRDQHTASPAGSSYPTPNAITSSPPQTKDDGYNAPIEPRPESSAIEYPTPLGDEFQTVKTSRKVNLKLMKQFPRQFNRSLQESTQIDNNEGWHSKRISKMANQNASKSYENHDDIDFSGIVDQVIDSTSGLSLEYQNETGDKRRGNVE